MRIFLILLFALGLGTAPFAAPLLPVMGGGFQLITKSPPYNAKKKRRVIKILSIDGGGTKGIIPLKVLEHIESKLPHGKTIADSFDVIAGTSTGGIIALLISSKNPSNKEAHKAEHIIKLYKNLSCRIFASTLWHNIRTGWGLWGPKYSIKPLEDELLLHFGSSDLKGLQGNVLVPAFELQRNFTMEFSSYHARQSPSHNFRLRDVARATSAAPTFFNPAQVTSVDEKHHFIFADGGISSNNPTLLALTHAIDIFGSNNDFFILSLGTGRGRDEALSPIENIKDSGIFGWAERLVSLLMDAPSSVEDAELIKLFDKGSEKNYVRIEPVMTEEHLKMDLSSPENIEVLELYAEQLIDKKEDLLSRVIDNISRESSTAK